MDSKAAVIRAEMNRTRAGLDHKIAQLEARVRDLSPRRISQRYLPDYPADRAIGAVLTLVGLRMAWSMWRRNRTRARVRAALESYGRP